MMGNFLWAALTSKRGSGRVLPLNPELCHLPLKPAGYAATTFVAASALVSALCLGILQSSRFGPRKSRVFWGPFAHRLPGPSVEVCRNAFEASRLNCISDLRTTVKPHLLDSTVRRSECEKSLCVDLGRAPVDKPSRGALRDTYYK
jgi:hypothetical protein